MNDEDRETIIEIARKALARFQPMPEAKAEFQPEPESKPEVQTEVKPKPVPGRKEKS